MTGVYHGDRRLLSLLDWRIVGHERELLASGRTAPDRHVAHWVVRDLHGRRALLTATAEPAGAHTLRLHVRPRP
ncbi:MAG: hypothetical protein KY460_08165 [Actinobacteria bacterium]|nr:hypothetical protein [Actinomycetota bacterium]